MNNKLDIMIEYQFYLISTVLANEPVKEMLLSYLLVSTRAVIGQFSGPYSPVRPAKI